MLELTRLRVVALEYHSFSIGVSADSFMGKSEIDIKDIQDWREVAVKSYKEDVIDINFDSRADVEKVLEKFNDEERRKIYDPLISSINNSSDYYISITDQNFTTKRKLKRIPSQTVDIILPKEIKKEPEKKDIRFYKTIVAIDESKDGQRK